MKQIKTNQIDSVSSLEEMKKELEVKFKKLVKVELLPGDVLHVIISEPNVSVEHVKKVVDILIKTKSQKYRNLKVSGNNDIVVIEK